MAQYSICSIIIDTDIISSNYKPFLIKGENDSADLKIRHIKRPYSIHSLIKTAEISEMIIWKNESSNDTFRWVYEARNGLCTIWVNKDYSYAEYCYMNKLDYFGNQRDRILDAYIKIIIECRLIKSGISILHSACVEINGAAFAFTGPSGVGKSTRAGKWCELLSAEWISGDRTGIDSRKGIVYGLPWDGKEAIYRNVNRPLFAILNVKRSNETRINTIESKGKLELLFEQLLIPLWDTELALDSLQSLKSLIDRIYIAELCCDITDESICKSFEIVSENVKVMD